MKYVNVYGKNDEPEEKAVLVLEDELEIWKKQKCNLAENTQSEYLDKKFVVKDTQDEACKDWDEWIEAHPEWENAELEKMDETDKQFDKR